MFGRKTKLGWQGEQYELTITMEVVESIDMEVNLLATAVEIDKGGIPKVTVVAKLYALLLQAAGLDVTKEDVYESMLGDIEDGAKMTAAARYAISLCFPQLESAERAGKSGKKGKG